MGRRIKPVHRLIDSWKVNFERRASSQLAVDPDESAALLDHPVNGGQPQPCALALRLRGEKRLKNMRLRFQTHPRAGVGYAEEYIAALANDRMLFAVETVQLNVRRLNDQLASIRHRVARVYHQVHDDLFHLAAVGA